MRLIFGWVTVLCLSGLLAFWCWPNVSQAAVATPVSLVSLEMTADLQNDGSVRVSQLLNFQSPTKLHWQLFSNVRDFQVEADSQMINSSEIRSQKSGNLTKISSNTQIGRRWLLHYTTTTSLIRHNDSDQVYLKVFQELGYPIGNVKVRFTLPTKTSEGLNGNVYAIHGATGASTVVDSTGITFSSSYTGAQALFTINANWPTSILRLTTWQELRLRLTQLAILPWLVLGLLLPLASLIVLVWLLLRQRRQEKPVRAVSETPPSALSPLLVGVIVNKKIYPEEIVALLIDLCSRGYVVISKKGDRYSLSLRRQPDAQLAHWERDILEQIFQMSEQHISAQDISGLTKQSLFSPKVRHAFAEIYQIITDSQIFSENPHLTRIRYKLVALGFYFFSIIGIIWTAAVGASPYLIIPLAGTMTLAFTIIRLSPRLISYTEHGQEVRAAWLAYANYLKLTEPLPLAASQNQTFEKTLPYAIALNQTVNWAKRFDLSEITIIRPDWFIAYEETSTAEFVTDLSKFTQTISETLASLRGPSVA